MLKHRAWHGGGARVTRVLGALVAVLLVITGCASIPTSGPVGTSAPEAAGQSDFSYAFDPPGPTKDASPQQIIEGFLRAGIDPQDDYSVAREYLARDVSREWRAADRTTVYTSEPNIVENVEKGSYTVEVSETSSIDEYGLLTRKKERTTKSVDFELVQVDGQWRLSKVPDGTMMDEGSFAIVFKSYPLYFYDSTDTYAVADYRWFATRQGLSATVTAALLAGPAPYLRNAVSSAFPEGSELARASVPVESKRATVDLNEATFTDANELQRQLMQQQLELTLSQIQNVSTVTMTVAQRAVSLGSVAEGFTDAIVEASVPNTQIAIANNSLVFYQGNGVVPVGGVQDISSHKPRDPAMSPADNRFAFLNGKRTQLFTVDESGVVHEATTGQKLLRPSIDVHGWTWTVGNDGRTRVRATPSDTKKDGPSRQVNAGWMSKADVTSLRVSPDGARALVIAKVKGTTGVYITGIIRDSEGVPRGFTDPLKLDSSVPVERGVWNSSDSVVVMKPSDTKAVQAEELSLDGSTKELEPLLGMTNISAGPGDQRTVYAETPDGVYSQVFSTWKKREGKATQLAYPG
ncbi:MAG: LpqB family beta-propeller domain-containing protein [Arthrobacter sp.]|uniref:LpqB family beta-propeller domain-containing protein n=1 Tax=unclassified Arthrobacter TaxID=235627 RepID=UPI002656548F|nr:LpqB family beta-propeller domain-containing protein [Micrococcaceae bacterium]MDN5813485.1 LpqB family beta-propeller domain-containing protein [Micrococcaceae bacterium]MDN5824638.1 LpqB family beta-propeller domain-containing protein [Micrococcaceae bacterium]MDN5879398.1 LpqB family beta-propeller domain-containing protein [Micrococcaceae bacterium]MDN5885571.1 LpqB family beta-propeller domain-containing protein [Micrococcaceae bacterium]